MEQHQLLTTLLEPCLGLRRLSQCLHVEKNTVARDGCEAGLDVWWCLHGNGDVWRHLHGQDGARRHLHGNGDVVESINPLDIGWMAVLLQLNLKPKRQLQSVAPHAIDGQKDGQTDRQIKRPMD